MEFARERPPEYVSTNPDELRLPSVPQHEVGTHAHHSDITLPGLRSVLAGLPERSSSAIAYDSNNQSYALGADHLAKLQSYTRASPASDSTFGGQYRSSTESAMMSPTETGSVMSVDDHTRRSTSVVSLEDPDVRLAAEALSGLGNPDFARTPTASRASHRTANGTVSSTNREGDTEEEPLLELLVEAHPWVGGTINGSLSAYTTTKGFTPRFVQYSANLIERNMVNTVSVVGRRTGVESGIRRYLGSRRPSDLERGDSRENHKRRKAAMSGDDMDIDELDESAIDESPSSSSHRYEFLPAYNKNSKPPSYRAESSPSNVERQRLSTRPPNYRNWSTKLMISTSGLGVALSDASLKSLTFCVTLLTKATEHVEFVMSALKLVLQDYEKAQEQRQREQSRRSKEIEAGVISRSQAEYEDATRQLADRIQQMCDDIMGTLKTVVDKVSTYTGGALPDNARSLVKRQLLSIPQRWRMASQAVAQQDQQAESSNAAAESSSTSNAEDMPRKAANRMIVFAQEGLDMMSQVNEVIKITLQSAEDWLGTFGRRQQPHGDAATDDGSATAGASPAPTSEMDVER